MIIIYSHLTGGNIEDCYNSFGIIGLMEKVKNVATIGESRDTGVIEKKDL